VILNVLFNFAFDDIPADATGWVLIFAAAGVAVALVLRQFKIALGWALLAGTVVFVVPVLFLPVHTYTVTYNAYPR
jgi:hypothetical protein